jgi:5-oxoprolinase (ATP-hydrolysing) subunit A
MNGSVDLNADLGEGYPHDAEILGLVSSANIACGGHAGDAATMRDTIRLCLERGVAIGAHPGIEDRENFGRIEVALAPGEAGALILRQLDALRGAAAPLGARVGHVKLHGALYNMASRDPALAAAVVDALRDREVLLFALSGSVLARAASAAGLRVVSETFADRAYLADGSLMPRSRPGSVIADAGRAAAQALRLAAEGRVAAEGGRDIAVDADTICLHGDGPEAVLLARRIRALLAERGIAVRAPSC